MSKELPPPLNSKSSRAELWDEINAMRKDIDSQQEEIRQWKAIAERAKADRDVAVGERNMANYQLTLIRAVLAQTITVRSTAG